MPSTAGSVQGSPSHDPPRSQGGTTLDRRVATTNYQSTVLDLQSVFSEIDGTQVAIGSIHKPECYAEDSEDLNASCKHAGLTIKELKVPKQLCISEEGGEWAVWIPVKSWTDTGRSEVLVTERFRHPDDAELKLDPDATSVFTVNGQKMIITKDKECNNAEKRWGYQDPESEEDPQMLNIALVRIGMRDTTA